MTQNNYKEMTWPEVPPLVIESTTRSRAANSFFEPLGKELTGFLPGVVHESFLPDITPTAQEAIYRAGYTWCSAAQHNAARERGFPIVYYDLWGGVESDPWVQHHSHRLHVLPVWLLWYLVRPGFACLGYRIQLAEGIVADDLEQYLQLQDLCLHDSEEARELRQDSNVMLAARHAMIKLEKRLW
jgi:hypothetical protein